MKARVYCFTPADASAFIYYATQREALDAYQRESGAGWVERLTTADLPPSRLVAQLLNQEGWTAEQVEIRAPREMGGGS